MLRSICLKVVKVSVVLSFIGAASSGCFWHHRHHGSLVSPVERGDDRRGAPADRTGHVDRSDEGASTHL